MIRSLYCPMGMAFVLAVLLASGGCGSGNDGPQRYALSGAVTLNGQPVPKGFVTLEPDVEQGNSGPGGGAEIVNGRYDTTVDRGIVGGPYRVRITGTDGIPVTISGEELTEGKPLFPPYETQIDFPKQTATRDFEVSQAAP